MGFFDRIKNDPVMSDFFLQSGLSMLSQPDYGPQNIFGSLQYGLESARRRGDIEEQKRLQREREERYKKQEEEEERRRREALDLEKAWRTRKQEMEQRKLDSETEKIQRHYEVNASVLRQFGDQLDPALLEAAQVEAATSEPREFYNWLHKMTQEKKGSPVIRQMQDKTFRRYDPEQGFLPIPGQPAAPLESSKPKQNTLLNKEMTEAFERRYNFLIEKADTMEPEEFEATYKFPPTFEEIVNNAKSFEVSARDPMVDREVAMIFGERVGDDQWRQIEEHAMNTGMSIPDAAKAWKVYLESLDAGRNVLPSDVLGWNQGRSGGRSF